MLFVSGCRTKHNWKLSFVRCLFLLGSRKQKSFESFDSGIFDKLSEQTSAQRCLAIEPWLRACQQTTIKYENNATEQKGRGCFQGSERQISKTFIQSRE